MFQLLSHFKTRSRSELQLISHELIQILLLARHTPICRVYNLRQPLLPTPTVKTAETATEPPDGGSFFAPVTPLTETAYATP